MKDRLSTLLFLPLVIVLWWRFLVIPGRWTPTLGDHAPTVTCGLLIAISVTALAYFRNEMVAFLVSAVLGSIVLGTCMADAEAHAPNSDLDGVFAIAIYVWGALLVVTYAAFFGSLALARFLRQRQSIKS